MTTIQKEELIDAICNFKTAADTLSNVWANLLDDDEDDTTDLLNKMYPFTQSFDDLIIEIAKWKDNVVESIRNEPARVLFYLPSVGTYIDPEGITYPARKDVRTGKRQPDLDAPEELSRAAIQEEAREWYNGLDDNDRAIVDLIIK